MTLHAHLSTVPSEQFLTVGEFVRQDFIDLSDSLEKTAFRYFDRDLEKLRLPNLHEHHKYALEETHQRFDKTVLISRWAELQELIQPRIDTQN